MKYKLTTISTAVVQSAYVELVPKYFRLSSHSTRSNTNIVQIYVSTISKQPDTATFNLNDPIPEGYDVSMYISNGITIKKIAKYGFNNHTGSNSWIMTDTAPPDDKTFWQLKCTSGTITVPFASPDSKVRLKDDVKSVPFSVEGMHVDPANPNLTLTLTKKWDQEFQYYATRSTGGRGGGVYHVWENHSVPITVNIASPIPIAVDSSDANNLSLTVNASSNTVSISGDVQSTGACDSNDGRIQQVFVDSLNQVFPPKLCEILNGISWGGISVLALKSILFPGKYMKLESAYCPGDMVLLGQLANVS